MTIMYIDELIGTYFKDLSHAPRKKSVYYVALDSGEFVSKFFSEDVTGRVAGVAEQIFSEGLCSLDVVGCASHRLVQILDEETADKAIAAWRRYMNWRVLQYAAFLEERYQDSAAYEGQMRAEFNEIADEFNIVIDFSRYRYREKGFIEFPSLPPEPKKKEKMTDKIKKGVKKCLKRSSSRSR